MSSKLLREKKSVAKRCCLEPKIVSELKGLMESRAAVRPRLSLSPLASAKRGKDEAAHMSWLE